MQVLTPLVQRFRRDGETDMGAPMATVSGNVAPKWHGGALWIAVLEEEQKNLPALNIEGAQPLISSEDGVPEQPGVKLPGQVKICDAEGCFQDGGGGHGEMSGEARV
jgi:hypothetical protein